MHEASAAPARTDRLRALSINHRTASLEELERVALSPPAAQQLCRRLLESGLHAVVLSTCHRVELYWESRDATDDEQAESALRASALGGWSGLEGKLRRLRGEVVAHCDQRIEEESFADRGAEPRVGCLGSAPGASRQLA